MDGKKGRKRMDLVLERVPKSEKGLEGMIEVQIDPDPDRYEWRHEGGQRKLFDRLDDEFMPDDWMDILVEGMSGQPIDCTHPDMPASPEEWAARRGYLPLARASRDMTQRIKNAQKAMSDIDPITSNSFPYLS